AARRDRALLDAVAEVRTSRQDLGPAGAERAYARAFGEAGLDVDGAAPAAVGAVLRSRPGPVAVAAAAALDDWALVRLEGRRPATGHELAHLLDQRGRGAEALAVFADLVARRPDDARHLACYGRCLKGRGRRESSAILDRAVAAGRAALRSKPDDAPAHNNLG